MTASRLLQQLPFLLGFLLTSAFVWAPNGLIHSGQRNTNATAEPALYSLRCIPQARLCP